jgi:hypothetical protein
LFSVDEYAVVYQYGNLGGIPGVAAILINLLSPEKDQTTWRLWIEVDLSYESVCGEVEAGGPLQGVV